MAETIGDTCQYYHHVYGLSTTKVLYTTRLFITWIDNGHIHKRFWLFTLLQQPHNGMFSCTQHVIIATRIDPE